MSCTHEQTANIVATASASAGACHFDVSAGIEYCDHIAEGSLTAEARIKTGSTIHIGHSCLAHAHAEAEGAEGGGLYNGRSQPYWKASASTTGEAELLAGPSSTYAGSLTASANTIANGRVTYVACPECDKLSAVAYTQGIPKLSPWADIFAYATAVGDWRIIGEFDPVIGTADTTANAAAIWSLEGEMVGIANMSGGETPVAAELVATASTGTPFASITYSNGLLKLDGIAELMLDLLPMYMADGDIIKRLMELFGTEIERAIYAREGYPADFSGVDGLVQQFAVSTATWGLDIWEGIAGIPVRFGDTDYPARRGLVLAKLAARKNEGEFWFKQRLELQLVTDTNPTPVVIINPGEPAVDPYTIELETNALLGEQSPTYASTLAAHGSPGLLTGVYTYKTTFVFQTGETDEGFSESPSLTTLNQRIIVDQIPISTGSAIARRLYRKNGPSNPWHLVTTITDNTTTTFVDNISDAVVTANPELSPFNTAVTAEGSRFLAYVNATKPAHIHVDVRSERFRASINRAGDPL